MKKIVILGLMLLICPTLLNAQMFIDKAAEFSLHDLEDNLIKLSDFKDRPVILFFWTTWCPYCRRGILNLNNLYPQLKTLGIELLAINIEETKEKIKRFLMSYPVKFKILLDTDADVAYSYNLLGVPAYVLIDKEGKIKFNKNFFPIKDYQQLILEEESKR